jgi:hypothetical protein
MPTSDRDERDAGTYTRLDFEAMAVAGDIEIIQPGTPEAAAFDREMVAQLDAYNAKLLEREGPDAMTSDRQLRQAALAAEQVPDYVAYAFAAYRERLGLDRDGLARWLDVGPDQLAALAITARPDPLSPTFIDEVEDLARRYGADRGRLAETLG